MRDRSVEYPNRYRMTLVDGTEDIYELTPVPGEVYEEGTLMSKANILDDNSEVDIWGTIGDRTPNDAFSFIGKSLVAHDKDIANLAAALEGKIVTGTYTGNGAASRTISLGFRPKVVIIQNTYLGQYPALYSGMQAWAYGAPAIATETAVSGYNDDSAKCVEIVADGFVVKSATVNKTTMQTNMSNQVFNYIAIA